MTDAFGINALTSCATARRALTRAFAEAGLDTPDLDARLLVGAASGLDHAGLVREADSPVGDEAAKLLARLAARRLAGEPVSRILGRREFWGFDLAVTPGVLDPRADTETLVEEALRRCVPPPGRILDLGSGSGAILCALLSEWPHAQGVAVDLSPAACATTQDNLRRCGLEARSRVMRGDWDAAVDGLFELIVSNPPYIVRSDIETLAVEVRGHDPHLALDGGADGLDAYRALAPVIARRLVDGGFALLEFGAGQENDVAAILTEGGLVVNGFAHDLAGRARVIIARRGASGGAKLSCM